MISPHGGVIFTRYLLRSNHANHQLGSTFSPSPPLMSDEFYKGDVPCTLKNSSFSPPLCRFRIPGWNALSPIQNWNWQKNVRDAAQSSFPPNEEWCAHSLRWVRSEQKDRKDYVVVQDRRMILYRLCLSLHELTAITRIGDFKYE
jgi:hypothetical protein